MQIAVAVLEVLVDLALAQPVVVQVIETRIGELGVERPQLPEVERIVLAVVDPGQELHQAACLPGSRMRLDRRLDPLQGGHGAADDRAFIPRQSVHPRPLAGDERRDGTIEFVELARRDVSLDMDLLSGRGEAGDIAHGMPSSEGGNRHQL